MHHTPRLVGRLTPGGVVVRRPRLRPVRLGRPHHEGTGRDDRRRPRGRSGRRLTPGDRVARGVPMPDHPPEDGHVDRLLELPERGPELDRGHPARCGTLRVCHAHYGTRLLVGCQYATVRQRTSTFRTVPGGKEGTLSTRHIALRRHAPPGGCSKVGATRALSVAARGSQPPLPRTSTIAGVCTHEPSTSSTVPMLMLRG